MCLLASASSPRADPFPARAAAPAAQQQQQQQLLQHSQHAHAPPASGGGGGGLPRPWPLGAPLPQQSVPWPPAQLPQELTPCEPLRAARGEDPRPELLRRLRARYDAGDSALAVADDKVVLADATSSEHRPVEPFGWHGRGPAPWSTPELVKRLDRAVALLPVLGASNQQGAALPRSSLDALLLPLLRMEPCPPERLLAKRLEKHYSWV